MTTRRWDTWWSNYFLALGGLSVLVTVGLGWMLSQRASSSAVVGADIVLVLVAAYGVYALVNVGLGLWIRRRSRYAWYVGMGWLVLSTIGSLATGTGGAVGGAAVSGIGLVLGYLARDRLLGTGAETAAPEPSAGPREADYDQTARGQPADRQPGTESRGQQQRQRGQPAAGTASASSGADRSQSRAGARDRDPTKSSSGEVSGSADSRATAPDRGGRRASGRSGGSGADRGPSDDGETKFCPYCGEEIPEQAGHCPYCTSEIPS